MQERLREAGIVLSKKGSVHRINFFGGLASTACYTDSLDDALSSGLAMAQSAANPAFVRKSVGSLAR